MVWAGQVSSGAVETSEVSLAGADQCRDGGLGLYLDTHLMFTCVALSEHPRGGQQTKINLFLASCAVGPASPG